MTVARADSGVEVLQFRRTDVAALLRAIVEQAQAFAEAKDLHLTSEIPNEPVWVDADPEFLNRLFLILIDNAVKYTPEKGKINVALGTNDGSAELKVTDTGIGIDDSDLPNIFERFYRADKARSRESGGVGLGLAIAKWIAEAHRGSILASSKVGAGSAFVVRIPVSSNGSEVRPA
jgi:signal transduction histidine kinase